MRQQDYDGDLECILVDDCTPDNSMIIAKSLIDSYHGPINFRILRNPENQGLSCSRNNGMSIAKGDYVFFLDSDDHISNNCIFCLFKQLYLYDYEIDMVVGNSFECRSDTCWRKQEDGVVVLHDHIEIMRNFLRRQIPMMAWNKLIRRDVLLSNNLEFVPQMIHEDELWSFQLYNVVKSVILIPEVTYYYEQNENSIMNSPTYVYHRVEACHTLVYKMIESLVDRELYIEKFFWGISMFMLAEDMLFGNNLPSNLVEKNRILRKQMIYRTINDGRVLIFVFLLLTIMPPCCYLIRFGWFRHKYHVIRSLFKKIAFVFNFVHR